MEKQTYLWTEALTSLKGKIPANIYDTFLAPAEAVYDGNGKIAILAPNLQAQQWLDRRLRPLIAETLNTLAGEEMTITFDLLNQDLLTQTGPGPTDNETDPDDDTYPVDVDVDDLLAELEEQNTLFAPTYSERNGQMIYTTFKTSDGQIISQERVVAPFTAEITEKLTIYDDYEQQVVYTVNGRKNGRRFTAKLSADDWADQRRLVSTMLRYLPGKPPATDPALRRHWGPAMASLTDERDMKEIKALNSTGWTPDGEAFVMPNGSYGRGYICQLEAGLDKEFQGFGLIKRKPVEVRKSFYLLLYGLPKIFRRSVIYTLLAHAFLAPLIHFIGDEARYVYHIYANTGSFKTELAKVIMSLFGPVGAPAITYKWSNTPYGAESRAHALKDVLMVIDDLKPGAINEADQAKWVAFVQAAVDAQGRKRATISGRASTALAPRALLLSTGEAIPEAGEASYTARMLLAELDRQPAGRNRLLDIIKNKAPLFSGLMYDYIAWLKIGRGCEALAEYQRLQAEGINSPHARLANNYASNRLGAVMLAKFCQDTKLLAPEHVRQFLADHQAGLIEIVDRTGEKAEAERYSSRFIEALHDALATGFCSLSDTADQNRIGWKSDKYVYLLNGAKDIVDQWLKTSGQTPINIPKPELRRQLNDDGLTYVTPARLANGKHDVQAMDPMSGSYQLVTAIHLSQFYQYDQETLTETR